MSPAHPVSDLAAPFALLTLAAAWGAGFLVSRAATRLGRRAAREREQSFRDQLDLYLPHRRGARTLRRVAARLEPEAFWSALDVVMSGLAHGARRDLERALDRSHHVRVERDALRDDSPWRRERAARRLATLGARRHSRALRRAMARGPDFVTLTAAHALGRARDRRALEWLLAHPVVIKQRSPQAHIALLRSFGPGAAPYLLAALERGPATRPMQRAVIETLAFCGHAPAAAAIAGELNDEWRDVRVSAARALGRLRATAHGGDLLRALHDPEWQVRAQAARALGLLREGAAVAALAAALSDRSWWVRRHAAYALLELGEPGRQALHHIADSRADRFASEIAAEALSGGFPGAALGPRRAAP